MIKIVGIADTLTVNCSLFTVNCLSFQRNDKPEFAVGWVYDSVSIWAMAAISAAPRRPEGCIDFGPAVDS